MSDFPIETKAWVEIATYVPRNQETLTQGPPVKSKTYFGLFTWSCLSLGLNGLGFLRPALLGFQTLPCFSQQPTHNWFCNRNRIWVEVGACAPRYVDSAFSGRERKTYVPANGDAGFSHPEKSLRCLNEWKRLPVYHQATWTPADSFVVVIFIRVVRPMACLSLGVTWSW